MLILIALKDKKPKLNNFLLGILISLFFISLNANATTDKIQRDFVAIENLNSTGLELFLNKADLEHDLQDGDLNLSIFFDGRSLLKEKTYPQNIKVEVVTLEDGKEKLLSVINRTVKNQKAAQNIFLEAYLPRIEKDTSLIVKVFDSQNILNSTFIEEVTINSSETFESGLESLPNLACEPADGDCWISYFLQNVTFSANFDTSLRTQVYKNDKGRYFVNIPIKKGRAIGSKVKDFEVNDGGNPKPVSGSYPFFEEKEETALIFWDELKKAITIRHEKTGKFFDFKEDGSFQINTATDNGYLNIAPGTSTKAAIVLDQGELLTEPVLGAIEFDGDDFYVTTKGGRKIFGETGPQGPVGPQGIQGPAGPPGSGSGIDLSNGGFLDGIINFSANGVLQDAFFNGTIQIPTGASNGYVLTSDANGFATWMSIGSVVNGDNLGNHTATQNLNLATNNILNATNVNGVTANFTNVRASQNLYSGLGAGVGFKFGGGTGGFGSGFGYLTMVPFTLGAVIGPSFNSQYNLGTDSANIGQYSLNFSDIAGKSFYAIGVSTNQPEIRSGVSDGAGAVAHILNTQATYSNPTAKFLSIRNNGNELAYFNGSEFNMNGNITANNFYGNFIGNGSALTGVGSPASGIAGAIQFSDGAGGFDSNGSGLFWDNNNGRLGIGTSSPSGIFSVGNGAVSNLMVVNPVGQVDLRHTIHNNAHHLNLYSPASAGSAIRFRLSGGGTSDYSFTVKPISEGSFGLRDNISGEFPLLFTGNNLVSGKLGVFNTDPQARFQVNNNNGNIPVAIFRSANSQSANITEWHSNGGLALANVSSTGLGTFAGGYFAKTGYPVVDIVTLQGDPGDDIFRVRTPSRNIFEVTANGYGGERFTTTLGSTHGVNFIAAGTSTQINGFGQQLRITSGAGGMALDSGVGVLNINYGPNYGSYRNIQFSNENLYFSSKALDANQQIKQFTIQNTSSYNSGNPIGSFILKTMDSGNWSNADSLLYVTGHNNGSMGIKALDSNATLTINGSLKYTDGNQSNGYVLTSDENGFATWANLASVVNGGGSAASGIAGAIQFSDGAGGFDSNANSLFWDTSNGRLGVGMNTPLALVQADKTGVDNIIAFRAQRSDVGRTLDLVPSVNNAYSGLQSNAGLQLSAGGANSLLFFTNSAESFRVDPLGNLGVGTTNPAAKLDIRNTLATEQGLILRAANGQTANLQEWKNFSGNPITEITATGDITFREYGADPRVLLKMIDQFSNHRSIAEWTPSNTLAFNKSGISATWGNGGVAGGHLFRLYPGNSDVGLSISTGAALAANPFEISANAGTRRFLVDNTFRVALGVNQIANARMHIETVENTTNGLIIQGAASQIANLTEWQNSAGTAFTLIDNAGNMTIRNSLSPDASLEIGNGTLNFTDGTDDLLVADDIEADGNIYATNFIGGTFNGTFIGNGSGLTGLVNSLNDLSDAKTDTTSLFVGSLAGNDDDGNNNNTGIGTSTMVSNTSGSYNTAVGRASMASNTIGSYNTALGFNSLVGNIAREGNVALGFASAQNSILASRITSVGLYSMFGSLNGDESSAFGDSSLYSVKHGQRNVAIGSRSLVQAINGNYNTALGYQSGGNIISGSNNIAIGYYANVANGNNNYQLNIGDTISGDLNNKNIAIGYLTGSPKARLEIGNGTANFIDGANDLLVADDAEVDGDLYVQGTFNAPTLNGSTFETDFSPGSVIFTDAAGNLSENGRSFAWEEANGRLLLNNPLTINQAALAVRQGSNSYAVRLEGNSLQASGIFEFNGGSGIIFSSGAPTIRNIVELAYLNAAANRTAAVGATNGWIFHSPTATDQALRVRGAAGQTGNLQEWQNSAGTALLAVGAPTGTEPTIWFQGSGVNSFGVRSNGVFQLGSGGLSTFGGFMNLSDSGLFRGDFNLTFSDPMGQLSLQSAHTAFAPGRAAFVFDNATTVSSSDLLRVDNNGTTAFIVGSGGTGYSVNIPVLNSADKGVIVRAAASQTANLQEWQDSTGTSFVTIGPKRALALNGDNFLSITGTVQGEPVTTYGIKVTPTVINGGAGGGNYVGIESGFVSTATLNPHSGIIAFQANPGVTSAVTLTQLVGFKSQGAVTSSGVVSNYYHFRALDAFLASGGTVNNQYGLKIESLTAGNVANYAIYTDRGLVRFNDRVTIDVPTASTQGLVIRAASSQSANLQEWQDANGANLTEIDEAGRLGIGLNPARKLHISEAMRIEPQASPPGSASLGDLYVDSDSNELCFYDGTTWTGIKAGGACI